MALIAEFSPYDEVLALGTGFDRIRPMKSLTLKALLGIGTMVLVAALGLMIWAGFVLSAHGG
jgi:hypothetical protein